MLYSIIKLNFFYQCFDGTGSTYHLRYIVYFSKADLSIYLVFENDRDGLCEIYFSKSTDFGREKYILSSNTSFKFGFPIYFNRW